jgi:hypothetical protein
LAHSPFQPSILQEGNKDKGAKWLPANDFSWWQDGTSNQLIVGEKHIPLSHLGRCANTNADADGSEAKRLRSDCTYAFSDHEQFGAYARLIQEFDGSVLARSPTFAGGLHSNGNYYEANGEFGFGSWHPGVCLFLIGDGSVRGISVTVTTQTMYMLADCKDGGAVSLP